MNVESFSTQVSSKMANCFCALPQELKTEVLSHLDAVSLICCAMTCTAMYEAFKSSSSLTYTIQLHLDGLKDGGTSLRHSVLIDTLVRRRQAWLALDVKEPLTRRTPPNCDLYELAGGAFAQMSSDHFEISRLPTARNADERTDRRPLNGILAWEFAMDPTQDLIVFFEDDGVPPPTSDTRIIRIHIRTMSSNTIHPRAQQSPLQLTVARKYNDANINSPVLQIAHEVVAIHFHHAGGDARTLVWDWTSSDLILDISKSFDPFLSSSLQYDFGLLDSTYCFATCESDAGSLRLYQLARPHLIHLATLHLPPTAPGIAVRAISSHTSPIEAKPLPDTPFTVDDEHRLHMFTVRYTHGPDVRARTTRYVNLFLHQHALLKYARRARAAGAPLDVPWAEWGAQHTRLELFSSLQNTYWKRYIYGQRAIFKLTSISMAEPLGHPVDVLDFSLGAVLAARGPSSSSDGRHGKLLPSNVLRRKDAPWFLDDVETRLPCVRSALLLKERCKTYMIYADGIVGVETGSEGRLVLHSYLI
ncbi:hypothetical protein BJ912DRAFT_175019 [Pholiota molesta]|nr:hypothetical protein BJ912DRAFT_175019 [Pholiota molesta]